jgi:hypothetical protein
MYLSAVDNNEIPRRDVKGSAVYGASARTVIKIKKLDVLMPMGNKVVASVKAHHLDREAVVEKRHTLIKR